MKQTEIGLIPDDWEVKEIKDFADVTTGNKNTQDAVENGKYPFYVRSPIVERINDYSFDSEGIITAGDGVGTGKVFHYAKGKFGLHQRAYLIHNFKDVEPKYFYFNFSKNFYERVHSMTAKSSVDSVRREMITKMQIPLPPTLAEQHRIAKALSDVDAVISTTEKLLQKKKNIKQGAMQNLLTGKKRLPGFATTSKFKQTELGEIPEDWEVKALEELCSLITKQTGFDYSATIKPALVTEPKKNTLPFIQNKDFEEEKINFKTDFFIPDEIAKKFPKIYLNEDVLLISISGRIGNVAYFKHTQDAFIGGAVGIAHFYNKHIIKYCMRYLLSPNGQKQIFANEKSGAQHNLTIADVRKLSIPMPANNDELTAITNVLSSMDKEIETLNTKLEKYRNLKTAMMQQLLTGKIRLK
ncbi:MAG: restriction endonuclease subunit S [Treponema sp.]